MFLPALKFKFALGNKKCDFMPPNGLFIRNIYEVGKEGWSEDNPSNILGFDSFDMKSQLFKFDKSAGLQIWTSFVFPYT